MTTTDTGITTEAPAADTAVIGNSILPAHPEWAYLARPAPAIPYLGDNLELTAKGFDDSMRAIAAAHGKALDDAALHASREQEVARKLLAKTAPRYDGTRYAHAGEGLAPKPQWAKPAKPDEPAAGEVTEAEATDDEPAVLVLRRSGKLERIPVRRASDDQEASTAALARWGHGKTLSETEGSQ